jgi:hypothetical protein
VSKRLRRVSQPIEDAYAALEENRGRARSTLRALEEQLDRAKKGEWPPVSCSTKELKELLAQYNQERFDGKTIPEVTKAIDSLEREYRLHINEKIDEAYKKIKQQRDDITGRERWFKNWESEINRICNRPRNKYVIEELRRHQGEIQRKLKDIKALHQKQPKTYEEGRRDLERLKREAEKEIPIAVSDDEIDVISVREKEGTIQLVLYQPRRVERS